MYRNIIFLQTEDDFESFSGTGGEGINGFFYSEEDEQLDYLRQWDEGPEGGTFFEDNPAGEDDTIIEVNYENQHFVLNKSTNYGYAGLCEKVTLDINS